MSRMTLHRAIGSLAVAGLVLTTACSDTTAPSTEVYTGSVDFGKKPKTPSPREGQPDIEYVEACTYYDAPIADIPTSNIIEFRVNGQAFQRDTVPITIRTVPSGPNAGVQYGYGCTDLWIQGGTSFDNVEIWASNPGGFSRISHTTQEVVRVIQKQPASEVVTTVEQDEPGLMTDKGRAKGNTGTTTTFLFKP